MPPAQWKAASRAYVLARSRPGIVVTLMSDERPAIPQALRRRVLVEAGHRCAIPTCRQHPVDVHHIVEWSTVRRHDFENLLALCPTCHRRMREGDIDRLAANQYKANLGVMNSRYEPIERRLLLRLGADNEDAVVAMPGLSYFFFGNLLADGLVEECDLATRNPIRGYMLLFDEGPPAAFWRLTQAGRDLALRLLKAEPLDPTP